MDGILFDLDGTLLTQNITEDKVGIVCHDPADNMASSEKQTRDPGLCWKWRGKLGTPGCAKRNAAADRSALFGNV